MEHDEAIRLLVRWLREALEANASLRAYIGEGFVPNMGLTELHEYWLARFSPSEILELAGDLEIAA